MVILEIGNYVYEYLHDNNVIYIGRTINIDDRIKQHKHDKHFNQYCENNNVLYENLIIKYIPLANSTEEDIVEKMLINEYKPILNTKDKHDSISSFIKIDVSDKWQLYKYPEKITKKKADKKSIYEIERWIKDDSTERDFKSMLQRLVNTWFGIKWLSDIKDDDTTKEFNIDPKNTLNNCQLTGVTCAELWHGLEYGRLNICYGLIPADCNEEETLITFSQPICDIKKNYLDAMKYSFNNMLSFLKTFKGYKNYKQEKKCKKVFDDNFLDKFTLFDTSYGYEDAKDWWNETKKHKK